MAGRWKRGLAVAGIFAFVGPVVGYLFLLAPVLIAVANGERTGQPSTPFGYEVLSALLFGYVFGGLPAVVTGMAAAMTSAQTPKLVWWMLICIFTGAAMSAIWSLVMFPAADWSQAGPWRAMGLMAGLGGLSALICALATSGFRPR